MPYAREEVETCRRGTKVDSERTVFLGSHGGTMAVASKLDTGPALDRLEAGCSIEW